MVPGEFDDVNEAVASEWEGETPPSERVREVIAHTYTPVSAESVADTARTSTKAARDHLDVLADDGFVTVESDGDDGRVYRRSPQSVVVKQATDIINETSVNELTARVSEMRERVKELENTDSESADELDRTRRNLAFANAALAIVRAERVIDVE
jgi:Fe2+ or Zn2+ uptake regulation protein